MESFLEMALGVLGMRALWNLLITVTGAKIKIAKFASKLLVVTNLVIYVLFCLSKAYK